MKYKKHKLKERKHRRVIGPSERSARELIGFLLGIAAAGLLVSWIWG